MEAEMIKLPNPLLHPAKYLKAKKIRHLQETSVTQEQYFLRLWSLLGNPNCAPVLIFGYDKVFMNDERTRKALEKNIKSTYNPNIKAIVAKESEAPTLEELARSSDSIGIARTNEILNKGYIVLGPIGVSIWDTTKITYHPEDAKKGVIFRGFGQFDSSMFPEHFFSYLAKARAFSLKSANSKPLNPSKE